jgi:uncharacterized membrane protein (DUF373 family)
MTYGIFEAILIIAATIFRYSILTLVNCYSIATCITIRARGSSSRNRTLTNVGLLVFKILLGLISIALMIGLSIYIWKDKCKEADVDAQIFTQLQILIIVYWAVTGASIILQCLSVLIAVIIDSRRY